MIEIEIGKRYTLVTPKGVINLAGVDAIQEFINAQRVVAGEEWKVLNPDYGTWYVPNLPTDWEWVWVVNKGEYRGTFPKRVAQYLYKVHGLKSPDSFLAQLGNLARQYSEPHEGESFDFDNQFDWEDGEFADSGSCYWWNDRAGLEALRQNGFMAIRFYRSAESDVGIARAWIYQLNANLYVLFNGYGYTTFSVARIFARFLGLQFKSIYLSNNHNTSGVLYINSDKGYLIGSQQTIHPYREYDFGIDVDEFVICENCERHLHEDDVYYSPYGEPYCESCFYNYFDNCSVCGDSYSRDDITYVDDTGEYVCPHCLSRHFHMCDSCYQHFRNNNLIQQNEEWYCPECFEKLPPEEPGESGESEDTPDR